MIKKIRVFFWTIEAFLKKHVKIIAIGLLLGIVAFLLIYKLAAYLPSPKKHERIGLIGRYSFNQLPKEILALLGEGLTAIGEDGSIKPGLASKWDISLDNLVYTFTLKDNIFWQDGKPIKADQIIYNFKDVESKVIDDCTISFILKEPFSPFPLVLSAPVFKNNFLGSGSYKVVKIKQDGNYIKLLKLSGPEKNIIYHFYPTVDMAKLGFKIGEVDILDGFFINPFEEDWLKYLKIAKQLKRDRYIGLFFNNTDALLGNKSLRQALSYAIKNKPTDESRALGPISFLSWAYNSQVKTYDYDPKNALNLLEKVKKEKNEEIKLKISTSQAFLPLAEEIQRSWEEILGIKISIEIINAIPQDYQIFLGMQEIPADPDQYLFWHSTRKENITNFKDPKIDKLLEDGRRTADNAKRKEKYFDFQKFLLEEAPVAFLSYPYFYKISRISIFP